MLPKVNGAVEWLRVQILLRALWNNEEIGQEIEDGLHQIADLWAKTYPVINPMCQQMGADFIKRYFIVDNPSLTPLVLADYHHQAIVAAGGSEAAIFRIEALSDDPTPLGRPTDREGRAYFAEVQDRRKALANSGQWKRVDVLSLWHYSEAWIAVRHKLVESLPKFIDSLQVRSYTKRNTTFWKGPVYEDADFSTRLRTWRRELQAIDQALRHTDWTAIFH
jgi:hypothetical protein